MGMVDENNVLVIVGEAQSGNCLQCEQDKCLTGLGHCLSVYESGISFIRAWHECFISFAEIQRKSVLGGDEIPILNMNRVRIDVESFQYRYPIYIDKVLNALELASLAFMKDARNYNIRPTNHPAITPDNEVINDDYRGRMQITMPGVYQGANAAFIKHECKGLYDQYIQGWKNKGIVHQMYKDFESRHNIVEIEFCDDEQNAIEYDNQNQNTQL